MNKTICPSQNANLNFCTCTYEPCERKGKCCACLQYHRLRNEIPGCFFSVHDEKTYDRSLAYYLVTKQKKTHG